MYLQPNPLRSPASGPRLGARVTAFANPALAALLKTTGVDLIEIDARPAGGHSTEAVSACAMLARALGVPAVVAVPSHERAAFGPVLEGGALGVHLPPIKHASQAVLLVEALRYAPMGARGTFEPGPQNDYADDPQDLAAVNALLHVGVELEIGLERGAIESIAAVEGIDALALADPAGERPDAWWRGLAELCAIARDRGKPVFARTGSVEEFGRLVETGVETVVFSSDLAELELGLAEIVRTCHGAVPQRQAAS